jgi:hypothetical protein
MKKIPFFFSFFINKNIYKVYHYKKKKHNVNTMQPLTILSKYTHYSTKKKLRICFILLWINKKIFAFVQKLLDLG